jgi:hypothetical protein
MVILGLITFISLIGFQYILFTSIQDGKKLERHFEHLVKRARSLDQVQTGMMKTIFQKCSAA